MTLELLSGAFSVCTLPDATQVDWSDPLVFLCKTDQELSLVCPAASVPANTLEREDGWSALRVQGPLDFSLVGILARLSEVLAKAGVSIFAVSTYCTDYLLVRQRQLEQALACLRQAGYSINK